MTPVKHTRTIHVDAPVDVVFRYIEDPGHLVDVLPARLHAALGVVSRTPEGTVARYDVTFSEFGMHLTSVFTRDEHVAGVRIVDHSSLGPVSEYAVEPDATGTVLTFGWDASRLMTMLDAVSWHSEKDVENALVTIKQRVEALA
jgi:hypothetical protein